MRGNGFERAFRKVRSWRYRPFAAYKSGKHGAFLFIEFAERGLQSIFRIDGAMKAQ